MAVGGDVRFRCAVNGNGRSSAEVRWMRADGEALPERADVREDLLIIRRVQSTDQGRYICVATTAHGRSQAEAELTVSGTTLSSRIMWWFDGRSTAYHRSLRSQ